MDKLRKAYLKYVFLAFLLPAVYLWASFITYHFIWDEWLYVPLADYVMKNPLDPLPSGYAWVPHSPMLWYMIWAYSAPCPI